MALELFTPQQELAILSELTRLGYVSENSPQPPGTRGHWICELEPPQPCIMACPSIAHANGVDDTGYVMLMIFPDGDLILHCGFTGRIDYLDSEQGLEAAVLEAESFVSALA
jgi:hypothetical protein